MHPILEEIAAWDARRPRSQQAEIGASGLYGCRAAAVLRLNGVEETDGRLRWDALVGTSIHMVAEIAAPDEVLVEARFPFQGVHATVDRYDPRTKTLTDLKSKEDAAAVEKVRQYGPSDSHVAQVQLGAAALQDAGHEVERIEILYVPRVGDPSCAYVWEGTPDRAEAEKAAEWAKGVTAVAVDLHGLPAGEQVLGLQDEPPSFCFAYCPFVTACRGTSEPPAEVDELLAATAEEYLTADAAEKAAKAQKDAARRFLEPYPVLPDGLGLRWQGGNLKTVEEIDLERVLADYEQVFGAPPKRLVEKTTARSLRRAS